MKEAKIIKLCSSSGIKITARAYNDSEGSVKAVAMVLDGQENVFTTERIGRIEGKVLSLCLSDVYLYLKENNIIDRQMFVLLSETCDELRQLSLF